MMQQYYMSSTPISNWHNALAWSQSGTLLVWGGTLYHRATSFILSSLFSNTIFLSLLFHLSLSYFVFWPTNLQSLILFLLAFDMFFTPSTLYPNSTLHFPLILNSFLVGPVVYWLALRPSHTTTRVQSPAQACAVWI